MKNFAKYMQILVVINCLAHKPFKQKKSVKKQGKETPQALPQQTLSGTPSLYQRCGQSVSVALRDPAHQQLKLKQQPMSFILWTTQRCNYMLNWKYPKHTYLSVNISVLIIHLCAEVTVKQNISDLTHLNDHS